MHIFFVDSIDEMLDIGKQSEKIGSYVEFNNSKYKLLGQENIGQSETIDCESYELTFKTKSSGVMTVWEDINGFKLFFYDK